MAALTLRPLGDEGAFFLEEEDGSVLGYGMARVSKAVPGYITLVTNEAPLGYAIRVPINWIETLESAENKVPDSPDTQHRRTTDRHKPR